MDKKRNPNKKGSKINNNFIITDKSKYIKDLEPFAKEFKDKKVFVNYDKNKKPFTPNTKILAKANDSSTWGTFEEAVKGLELPFIIGIGIELCINLFCADGDDMIKNKIISPRGQKIIDELDTYTEYSMSGNGFHTFGFGNKKGKKCKIKFDDGSSLELYSQNHFIALTGNSINNKKIENRQNALNKLYSEYFQCSESGKIDKTSEIKDFSIEKLAEYQLHFEKALKLDSKLSAYYNGERPTGDESADDFGFAIKLLYWLNNVELAIKFFLASPYFQQKDKKHKDKCLKRKDYLHRTFSLAFRRF